MAESLEFGILDLFPEILADALCILAALKHAGTVPAGALKTVLDGLDHLGIWIERDLHVGRPVTKSASSDRNQADDDRVHGGGAVCRPSRPHRRVHGTSCP